jgi:hypothetical protein
LVDGKWTYPNQMNAASRYWIYASDVGNRTPNHALRLCSPDDRAAPTGLQIPCRGFLRFGLSDQNRPSIVCFMFSVDETTAEAIRRVFEESGELAAVVELRRHFPGIADNEKARLCVRAIAGWKPLPPCQNVHHAPAAAGIARHVVQLVAVAGWA